MNEPTNPVYTIDEILSAVRVELSETNKALSIADGFKDSDYVFTGVIVAAAKRLPINPAWLNLLPESVGIWARKYEDETGHRENVIELNGEYLIPRVSQMFYNHSPDGFNWGYSGSGPAQLALAILLEYLPYKIALQYYQQFKFEFIAGLPQTDFDISVNLREIFTNILQNEL